MARMSDAEKREFRKAVYEIVAAIPVGKVTSYGVVAVLAGYPGYQRMVGRALRDAYPALDIPCHRVLTCQGRLVPGWSEHPDLLKAEGIPLKSNGYVDMNVYSWDPLEMLEL